MNLFGSAYGEQEKQLVAMRLNRDSGEFREMGRQYNGDVLIVYQDC